MNGSLRKPIEPIEMEDIEMEDIEIIEVEDIDLDDFFSDGSDDESYKPMTTEEEKIFSTIADSYNEKEPNTIINEFFCVITNLEFDGWRTDIDMEKYMFMYDYKEDLDESKIEPSIIQSLYDELKEDIETSDMIKKDKDNYDYAMRYLAKLNDINRINKLKKIKN